MTKKAFIEKVRGMDEAVLDIGTDRDIFPTTTFYRVYEKAFLGLDEHGIKLPSIVALWRTGIGFDLKGHDKRVEAATKKYRRWFKDAAKVK